MTLSIKSITLMSAVILTGLSAGLFYAWAVSVIPGLRRVSDTVYLESMQSINRAILNPAFFLSFIGCMPLLIVSSIQQYQQGLAFWLLLAATGLYLVGTFGVTALGNVPLNNYLDAIQLPDLQVDGLAEVRAAYEAKWNQLHMIRTLCSILAFGAGVGGLYVASS